MGPAYLLDVVGMDTAVHANAVMAEGFPDRMARDGKTAIQVMYDNKRLGQKNDLGFYRYEEDRKGKPKKLADDEAQALVAQVVSETREFSDEDIIARMMVPLCMETIRCLEDDIVGSPAEADMALIYGIGFPPFRGGALRYVDAMGVAEFVALADSLADELGPLYRPTEALRERAKRGEAFYS
ncbi:3-hydroxyacyl-CoA dehydrogenase family protein, partial [uncultured Cobetia sp.]